MELQRFQSSVPSSVTHFVPISVNNYVVSVPTMNLPPLSSPASPAVSWFSGVLPHGHSDKSASLNITGNPGYGVSFGPIKGKNQFRGVLFKYGQKPAQMAGIDWKRNSVKFEKEPSLCP